jgi:hypothetical protein
MGDILPFTIITDGGYIFTTFVVACQASMPPWIEGAREGKMTMTTPAFQSFHPNIGMNPTHSTKYCLS